MKNLKKKKKFYNYTPPPSPSSQRLFNRRDKQKVNEVDKIVNELFGETKRWELLKTSQISTTYIVCHPYSHQKYILKYLNPALLTKTRRNCAKLEFLIGKNLDHPNLVKYYECWCSLSTFYFQIEYCQLGSLDDLLYNECFRDTDKEKEEVWLFILDILRGLDYLHQSGYVHLDIKPGNIFVTKMERRTLKIGDFGNVCKINNPVIEEGDGRYIAPEILSTDFLLDLRLDIYSAGITIYEMGINSKITDQIWLKLKEGDYQFLSFYRLSKQLQELLKQMLHSNILERPTASSILNSEFLKSIATK
jgi:wee1-like protein kinase